MKKQALALAIAGILATPQAFAAQDTSGMQYTSAAEGFYATIRAHFVSSKVDKGGANIDNNSSRWGVRGTNDLGGGLEGFYQYEQEVDIRNGSNEKITTRLSHVGLRGGFGEVFLGSNWASDYNFVHGSTDISNVHSGNLNYTDQRPGRVNNAIQYTSPDLSGFQGALRVVFDSSADASDNDANTSDDNDVDAWNIAGIYNVQGFTAAVSYNVIPNGWRGEANAVAAANQTLLRRSSLSFLPGAAKFAPYGTVPVIAASNDDITAWTARLGYAQDNWYVTGWYGEDNNSDFSATYNVDSNGALPGFGLDEDTNVGFIITNLNKTVSGLDDSEFFSIAAGVEVSKVNLYAVYEQSKSSSIGNVLATGNGTEGRKVPISSEKDSYATIGVQYNLGAQSRVWIEYAGQDLESDTTAEDFVSIGMRHDF